MEKTIPRRPRFFVQWLKHIFIQNNDDDDDDDHDKI